MTNQIWLMYSCLFLLISASYTALLQNSDSSLSVQHVQEVVFTDGSRQSSAATSLATESWRGWYGMSIQSALASGGASVTVWGDGVFNQRDPRYRIK